MTDAESAPPVRVASRWLDVVVSLGLALGALLVLLATSHDYGMVWDEGHTVRRERTLQQWFSWLVNPPAGKTRSGAFDRRVLDDSWPFSRKEPDGHPPFYALLGLAGWWLSHRFVAPLTAYRFGPMSLTAATVGALYLHLARRYGRLAGLTAALGLLLMPHVFSLSHYAHYDMPVTCLWLLAQAAFINGFRSFAWVVPFGVLLGLAAGTKFTGWFAPVAPMLWVASFEGGEIARRLFRSGPGSRDAGTCGLRGLKALVCGLAIAAVTLVAIQPRWWSNPLDGVLEFLSSNLTRSATKPIPTLYFGQVHAFSLPWHNTIVLTAITTPVLMLVLAGAGVGSCLLRRRQDPTALVWLLSWIVLMVVRALPNAPGHDGVRLFLPSIGSLAVLAGLGAGWLRQRLGPWRLAWLACVFAGGALAEEMIGIQQLYPYTLSYYNSAFGGLPAAETYGFELTYYWDTMGPEFLDWVHSKTRTERLELRFPSPLVNVVYLREWGHLPPTLKVVGFDDVTSPYYVLQRRRGVYYPYDWWLDRRRDPAFRVTRQRVDLLRVYAYPESFEAYSATKDVPTPAYLRY